MRRLPSLLPLIAVIAAALAAADIVPVPGSQRIQPIFELSDLVCYCEVESVSLAVRTEPNPKARGWVRRETSAVLEIIDSYKQDQPGQRSAALEEERDVPAASGSYPAFRKGDRFLLFLKSTAPGKYVLADPFSGATFFSSIQKRSEEPGLHKLEAALAAEALHSKPEDVIRALRLLGEFDNLSEETASTIEPLAASQNGGIALAAISATIDSARPKVLQHLLSWVNNHNGEAQTWDLINIGTKLATLRGDRVAPLLGELTSCKYRTIREGAMRALRQRKDPRMARLLVERLDDKDSDIRYLAVIALAETFQKFDGDYAPSMYLFDKKPAYYTALWKEWWQEQGAALLQPKNSE